MDKVKVEELKNSVTLLLKQIEKLKLENQTLRAKATANEARAHNAEQKNKELLEQNTTLLLKNSLTEVAGSTKAAKLRINKLLKDIDKCIALSSK